MHEKQYKGGADRLRALERVMALATEGLEPGAVLDVGTGTGLFAEAFAAAGWSVAGTDLNGSLLALAREAVPGGDFREAPAERQPFGDASFDVVFLGHLLHEVEEPAATLKEAARVARRRVIVLEWPYREGDELGPPLAHRLPPETVLAAAREAGFASSEHVSLRHMDLYRLTV